MNRYKNEHLITIQSDILELFPLDYVKNYLRIDNDYDDDFLKNAIATACNYAEKYTNTIIGLKTFNLTFQTDTKINQIEQSMNISQIVSIKNNNNEIDCENYKLENGKIFLKKALSGYFDITFKAGTPFDEVLIDIRQAIMYHVAKIYNNKDGDFSIPQSSIDIYNLYKPIKI